MVLFGDNLELLPLGDRLLGPGEAGPDAVLIDAMDLEHRNHRRGAAGEHERRDQKDGEALHHARILPQRLPEGQSPDVTSPLTHQPARGSSMSWRAGTQLRSSPSSP